MRGTTRTSRIAAYVASGALVLSGTILAASPAEAVTYDPQPAAQAATWLENQLTDGVVHNNQYDFDDIGLTADVALALSAVPGHGATVTDIVDTIEPRAQADWYTSTFEGVTTTYAGSLAKALVLAQTAGSDPTSYGGVNLVTLLENHTAGGAPIAGRIEHENDAFGDANVIGQAYAARGLAVAGSSEATAATNFLLKQQCPNGGFRLDFTASKTASDQSCTNNTSAQTDATAIAVLQLASQSGTSPVTDAIAKAKAWLTSQQRCDGSFGGGTSTEESNANSTGLVGWALGDSPTSRQAAGWLRKHQATAADSGNSLASETGAIAYDNPGLAAGRSSGITDSSEDQWRRATAQAAPGIRWFSSDPTPAVNLTGPTGYVKAGSRPELDASGAAAGTVLCTTGPGTSLRKVAGAAPVQFAVSVPAGSGTRVYTVRDPFGHAEAHALRALGAKTLTVAKSKSRVKRSGWVTARIVGLASQEAAKIYYKGNLVRTGKATTAGVFSASFRVGRSLGLKRITGLGQFGDIRRGSTTVRVVR